MALTLAAPSWLQRLKGELTVVLRNCYRNGIKRIFTLLGATRHRPARKAIGQHGFVVAVALGLAALTPQPAAQAAAGPHRAVGKKPHLSGPKRRPSHVVGRVAAPRRAAAATKARPVGRRAPPPPPPLAPKDAPVLDLSAPLSPEDAQAAQKARQEILGTPHTAARRAAHGTIDFGGGIELGDGLGPNNSEVSFDFAGGTDALDINLVQADANAAERAALQTAMGLMADEVYDRAAVQFRLYLADPAFAAFVPELQYQLGRALYKLGFFAASHAQFQTILQSGPSHRRFAKAIEWLFFMSRKMADQEPVLAELAKFRNATFPKAYHDEYAYLLAKYLFIQANNLEVRRLQDDELMRGRQGRENTIDFGAVASAIAGEATSRGQASTLDFSNVAGALDFGGQSDAKPTAQGLDFGAATAPGQIYAGVALDFAPEQSRGEAMSFGSAKADADSVQKLPTTTNEAVKQSLELVAQISQDSDFYPRGKYLEGLLHYLSGADQKAVEAYQEVVRILAPKDKKKSDPKLREMAFLSLARLHFGHKQFNRSAYYYDLIDRDSEHWLVALFEASWAYYQRGDYEKALGNLLTLHAPFFEQEYFPESQIVRATIYFEGCRYAETRQIVDDFIPRYTRLMHEVQKIAESKDPPELLYAQVMQLTGPQAPSRDDTAMRVLNLMLRSPEIQTAQAVLTQVEKARYSLQKTVSRSFQQSTLGQELAVQLDAQALEASGHAGEVIRQKFEVELYKLKSLLGQALRIKIEVARSERDVLEAKSHNQQELDKVVPALARTVVDDEHVFWPYEGEYWRDELGTYELDFSMCRPLRD